MRTTATTRFVVKIEAAAGALLALLSSHLWAQSSVSCSNPPGPSGTVYCESGTPLCEAQGGSFVAYCVTQAGSREEQARNLLRRILGAEPTAQQLDEYVPQLEAGSVELGGRVYTFPPVEQENRIDRPSDLPREPAPDEKSVADPALLERAPGKVRCRACLDIGGQEYCETFEGDTRDGAQMNALGKLYLELKERFDADSIDMNASRVNCDSGT